MSRWLKTTSDFALISASWYDSGSPVSSVVEKVEDRLLYPVPRRLLCLPVADGCQFRLQRGMEIDGDLFDAGDLGRRQLFLLEQVEQGQRRLVEALAEGARLLIVELGDELEERLERLFNRHAVLFPIVVGDQFLVVLLEVGSQRVLCQHQGKAFLDGALEILHLRVPCRATGELLPQALEVDGRDVVGHP